MVTLDLVVPSKNSEYWAMAGGDGGLSKEGKMDGQAFLQPGGNGKEAVLLCSYNMPVAIHFYVLSWILTIA